MLDHGLARKMALVLVRLVIAERSNVRPRTSICQLPCCASVISFGTASTHPTWAAGELRLRSAGGAVLTTPPYTRLIFFMVLANVLPFPCSQRRIAFPGARRLQAGPKRTISFFLGRPDMGKKLYVGNLTYGVTDSTLAQLFEGHGTVQSAQVIMDRDTGRSKGFGFVEMGSDAEAQAAIQALNGKEVEGRALTVNEAKPREDRGGGRGGHGGGSGGRGGYGGGRDRRY